MGLLGLSVKQLVKLGYPESTAIKIASGELPMDTASRMARAKAQGYNVDMPLYHWSDVEGIAEMRPSTRGKIGPGVYTSPRYDYGRKYTASDDPFLYEMFRRGESASQDAVSASLDQARDERNAIGKPWDSTERKTRANKILEGQGYTGKEIRYTGSEELPLEVTSFSGKDLRRVDAAFDPDHVGSANLLASGKVPTAATGLLGVNEFNRAERMSEFEEQFALQPDQQRGTILPIITDDEGFVEFGTPEIAVDVLRGLFDIGQSRKTGVVSPTSIFELL